MAQELPRSEEKRTPIRAMWREHLALIVSGSVIAIFVLKVTAVAHGSATTALGIIQKSSPSSVVLGVGIVTLAPMAYALAVGLLIENGFKAAVSARPLRDWAAALLGAAMLAIGLFSMWIVLAPVIAILVLYFIAKLVKNPLGPASLAKASPRAGFLVAVYVVLFASILVSNDEVWLPTQELMMQDGSRVVGYLLDREEMAYVLLREEDRVIERIPLKDVQGWAYCKLKKEPRSPLIFRLRNVDPPSYPRCK